LRTPPDSRLVSSTNGDLLILFTDAPAGAQRALEARGVRVERLAEGEPAGHIVLGPALRHLAKSEITSVLVEGGARLNAAMLNSKLVDKLVIFYAPILLGADAIPALAADLAPEPIGKFTNSTLKSFGDDFAFEAYLRDPWAGIA
jgi:diaminohydroxyphosphoribosylaminopyrimidine deaminase / 5-amino-6-(5-phosphoribosylamino)uracil reductase